LCDEGQECIQALIRDAVDEYLNFSNIILYLRIVNPASSDGSVCPACRKVSNNISMSDFCDRVYCVRLVLLV
jgi:hypothetical protein